MSTEATEAARKYGAIDCSEIARIRYIYEHREYTSQRQYAQGLEDGYGHALFEHAAPLEAEVAKLRALVQKILDLSFHDSECHITEFGGPCDCLKSVITAAAKEQGFTPTNTEDK